MADHPLGNWTDLLSSKAAEKMMETDLLGYVGLAPPGPVFTLTRESLVRVDGRIADAAVGRFIPADSQAD
jgi:hypothetical protein